MENPTFLLGIRTALSRHNRRQMIGTIKDIDNPVIGSLARTESLNIYKTDFLRLARFIALDVANPNTGIKLFAGKSLAADIQFEFFCQSLSRRRNQISEKISADYKDDTGHQKHAAESPRSDAGNAQDRKLAR